MASRSLQKFEQLQLEARREVDQLCNLFEIEWQAGHEPSIENYLGRVDANSRCALLTELLVLDFEYRARYGHSWTADDYADRFPEFRGVIDEAVLPQDPRPEKDPSLADTSGRSEQSETYPNSSTNAAKLDRSDREPTAQELPRVLGYEVLEKLGTGGMGIVYKARHLRLKRMVALKLVLHSEWSTPRHLARFLIEGEMLARVQHANIVQVFEVGLKAERPFLVLEYVEGGTLSELLQEHSLAPRESARLIELLARAMHHAHLQGVVHRDLKPANVLIKSEVGECDMSSTFVIRDTRLRLLRTATKTSLRYLPKITDFGLARGLDASLHESESGLVMGTPSYMAPEQFMGIPKDVGPAADIYALGTILYEILTRRRPYESSTPIEAIARIEHSDLTPPRHIDASIPRDLQTICLKCLEKVPQRRYASAEALADDLARWLNNEPIMARPVSTLERFSKWSRRRPALVASLTSIVASILIVAVVACMAAVRLQNERDAMLFERERAQHAEVQSQIARVNALLTAAPEAVPFLLDSLKNSTELAIPLLRRTYRRSEIEAPKRLRAAIGLTVLGDPQPEFLVSAIPRASPSASFNLVRALRNMPHPDVQEQLFQRFLNSRQLNDRIRYAALALELGDARGARQLLQASPDPAARTAFVEQFQAWHGDLAVLPRLLREHQDADFQSGLCAAIGRINPEHLSPSVRRAMQSVLRELYLEAVDGGTHSAAGWSLRQWGAELPTIEVASQPRGERDWFVNESAMTMLAVPSGAVVIPESTVMLITRPIFMSDGEVTVEQFDQFVRDPDWREDQKPTNWQGPVSTVSPEPGCPVNNLSREEMFWFCNWLSRRSGRQPCYHRSTNTDQGWQCDFEASGYRLPTEAEWDHAHRAGASTIFFFGDDPKYLPLFANVAALQTMPGGSKLPNRFGFFDMLGNVWEFCWDYYGPLPSGAVFDPTGPDSGSDWVSRGGAFDSGSYDCRANHRLEGAWKQASMGFRVVCGSSEQVPRVYDSGEDRIQMLSQTVEAHPDNMVLRRARADYFAQSARWQEAAADLRQVVYAEPQAHWHWFQCAPLLVLAGDADGYRQHCQQVLKRFGDTTSPRVAERIAKTCLLSAGSVEDIEPVRRLSQMAIRVGRDDFYAQHFQVACAMADYRAGRFSAAVDRFEKTLASQEGHLTREVRALARFMHAMTLCRLDRLSEAREAFDEALQLVGDEVQALDRGVASRASVDMQIATIAYREARTLLLPLVGNDTVY